MRNKYKKDDAVLDAVVHQYEKRARRIKKQARETAMKIARHYEKSDTPLHAIIDKMRKYKHKHKWTDFEFDEFRKELSNILTGARVLEIDYGQHLITRRSKINKVLGGVEPTFNVGDGLNIKESEQPIYRDLSIYDKSLQLYNAVRLNALTYGDCDIMAMLGNSKGIAMSLLIILIH